MIFLLTGKLKWLHSHKFIFDISNCFLKFNDHGNNDGSNIKKV